jgi:hypothetical protein
MCGYAATLLIAGQLGTATWVGAIERPPVASTTNQASSAAYLTVIIGRAMESKAVNCKTPAGMLTLDQIAPQLAKMGVNLTAAVIPDRTLATTTNCVNGTLYPGWTDLSSLAATDGLNVVSASQSYDYMTTLTQTQQFQQSCGSLSTFIAHGFHRAWGVFAYPDNYYSTAIQSAVVQNCFAFGRTYISPHKVSGAQATNSEATTVSPWLQKTNDVGGGRCNLTSQPCDNEGSKSLGKYLSPVTLHALTQVSPGTWTAIQGYAFATGTSTSGSIKWDCSEPETDWQAHWTSQFETYCWNDFVYALTGISSSVTVTDPATVAEAWGRIPTPLVTISSVNPSTLTSSTPSTAVTWSAEENGTYSVLVGGTDCNSGTQVAGGMYSTSPSSVTTTVAVSAFTAGSNALRVCLTNDAGHTGLAATTVTLNAAPTVTSVSPDRASLSGGIQVTVTGTNFMSGATVTVGGVAATSVNVVSPTSITAYVPAAPNGIAGTYDVIVTDADGTSQVTTGDQFTYEAAPSVTGVSPPGGPIAGGTQITITGLNFYSDATVTVGGVAATVESISPTSITAVTPQAPGGLPGAYDVVVAEAGGSSPTSPQDLFTYS